MYETMRKLISNHFYNTAEEAMNIINTFLACKQLTAEEYSDLVILVQEVYGNVEK